MALGGNQRRQQRVAKRRQRGAAPPGVLDHRSRSSSAPALALPACSRNRGAEGGSLGPSRPTVRASSVLPTPRVVAGCSLARSSAGWSSSRRLCRSSLASCRAGPSRRAIDASMCPETRWCSYTTLPQPCLDSRFGPSWTTPMNSRSSISVRRGRRCIARERLGSLDGTRSAFRRRSGANCFVALGRCLPWLPLTSPWKASAIRTSWMRDLTLARKPATGLGPRSPVGPWSLRLRLRRARRGTRQALRLGSVALTPCRA